MTSDAPRLLVHSDPDVQITIYDAHGAEHAPGQGGGPIELPRGLYRIRLERCGFVHEELILHDSTSRLELAGPLVESPAPLTITDDPDDHGPAARQLSTKHAESCPPLGEGPHDARLFVFVRRMSPSPLDAALPSEPVSVHDLTGRRLTTLAPDAADRGRGLSAGYVAMSCRVTPGTYRLRVGRTRRDLAVSIPAQRAAHVFLADRGTISLRTARVYLPPMDAAFDPGSAIARAMESVLWALSQPGGELPIIARRELPRVASDPSFGILCAHLARRQGDRGAFDQIMRTLTTQFPDLPDVAILSRGWQGRSIVSPGPALGVPPLLRASLVLALDDGMPVGSRTVLAEAAKTVHGDSVWCTWSPRWWDERWISPTVDRWRSRRDGAPPSVDDIARATLLPSEIVERVIAGLDAASPRLGGAPVSTGSISVDGYELGKQIGRGERSTVYTARRVRDGARVAVKIIPTNALVVSEADAQAVDTALADFAHPGVIEFGGCRALAGGSAICVELELCRESLFDRIAARGHPMMYDEACAVVLQALDALGALHDRGLVHGNIHPGNLFIRMDGTVVLGLPGLPLRRLAGTRDEEPLADGDRVPFMAPECAGRAAASPCSDTWSMAATLYFLLTLELPRERYTDQSEAEAAQANAVIPIGERLTGLPTPLVECLQLALSASLERRFAEAKAFHDALHVTAPAARAVRLHDDLVRQDPAYATTLRNVFLRLTTLVDGKPPWVARDEFRYGHAEENERVEQVLQRFHAAGLMMRDAVELESGEERECVRLAHDQLVHDWTRIRTWHDELDTAPDTRSVLSALGDAVRRWQRGKRQSSLLWSDQRVTVAHEIHRERRFVYNVAEAEFVRRSGRRRVVWRAGFFGAVAALAVVSGCVFWQRQAVRQSATERRDAEHRYAASQQETGRNYVLEGRSLHALPYLVEAARLAEPGPALRMLVHATRRGLPLVPGLDHKDEVTRAAFRPDGKRIVTACADGTAYVWDATTGKQIVALVSGQDRVRSTPAGSPVGESTVPSDRAHAAAVVSAAFSPDGKWIVTASEDWTAAIWNADTGRRHGKLLQHDGTVESAMFSFDGQYVVTASLDHSARIWSAATGDLVYRLDHADAVMTAMFNRNGTRVVTASTDGTARIWNAGTGASEHTLEHKGPVLSAAFSADGTRVVTASQDRTAQIWDTETGQHLAMKGLTTDKQPPLELHHRDGVTGAIFDASGAYVVTTSDNGARVWDAATGAPVTPWLEHRGRLNSAVFAPGGGRLLTASADGTARIWETATGRMLLPVLEHTESVASAVFSADGTRIVTASADRTAQIWDASGTVPTVKLDLGGIVRQAGFSPDGRRLVATSDDATVRIWDAATGTQGRTLPHHGRVLSAAFSVDGTRIVTTSDDQVARIWDTDGRMIAAIRLPEVASSATLCPDGTRLITSGGDASRGQGTLRLWDTLTGASVPLLSTDTDKIMSAAVNQDCTRLVALSQERTARIWDPVSGKAVTGAIRLPGEVTSVAISLDGAQIVTSGNDSTARVWDVATGKEAAPALEHDQPVVSAAFSPDGARILTISGDRTVQVWDAKTGKPLTPLLYTDDLLVTAAFSADGNHLFAADRHAVRTWDVALEDGAPSDWAELARKTPYVLDAGVLVPRALALRAGAHNRHDDPILSF